MCDKIYNIEITCINMKKELIQKYIDGWKEGNSDKIRSVLSNDCVVIESHGPTYNGKDIISKWINEWLSEDSTVDKWDVTSFYEIKDTVFVEWIFECTVKTEKHYIE